ncbi:MAG: ABC transporter permease [Planctomycetes bacterium]|nr:ABC transporter permease [Planctomycetota bacterium]
MSLAIVRKTFRDTLWVFLLLTLAIVAFEMLFVRAMSVFAGEITEIWFSKEALRRLIQMMVGADLAENATPTGLMTVGFAHPLLYAFTWTLILTICTRVIAGEIDRGTADLLLTLPISRASLYVSVSLVWLVCGVPISVAPL